MALPLSSFVNPGQPIFPGEYDIHLWLVRDSEITDPDLLERYRSILSEEELEKTARFHFEKDRHQHLITRATLRTVLSLYHPYIAPEKWRFIKNEHGKPFADQALLPRTISGDLPVQFNISHTEGLVCLAISRWRPVGVDVENTNREGRLLDIADRYFSPQETEDLFALPEDQQRERFFDLWTLKEAYIKACGMGLAIPLSHFSFHLDKPEGIDVSFAPEREDNPDFWRFWRMQYGKNEQIALAMRDEKPEVLKRYRYSCFSLLPMEHYEPVKPETFYTD